MHAYVYAVLEIFYFLYHFSALAAIGYILATATQYKAYTQFI